MIKKKVNRPSLFNSLADMLDQSHPLYRLADKIDWRRFEEAFTPLYSQGMGAPAKDIRLMCGLLILTHVRDLSDESVVEQWSENAYYRISVAWTRSRQAIPAPRPSWFTSASA